MNRRVALLTALVVVFGITGGGAAPVASAAVRWHPGGRYGINPPTTPPPWRVVYGPRT